MSTSVSVYAQTYRNRWSVIWYRESCFCLLSMINVKLIPEGHESWEEISAHFIFSFEFHRLKTCFPFYSSSIDFCMILRSTRSRSYFLLSFWVWKGPGFSALFKCCPQHCKSSIKIIETWKELYRRCIMSKSEKQPTLWRCWNLTLCQQIQLSWKQTKKTHLQCLFFRDSACRKKIRELGQIKKPSEICLINLVDLQNVFPVPLRFAV